MKKRTVVLWKKILTWTLISAFIFGVFYVYFRTGLFTITNYEIVGAPEEMNAILENKVKEISLQPIYKVIPSNRTLSFQDTKIKQAIQETLPDTSDVSIKPASLNSLRITITKYSPAFRMENNQAVTSDGYVYDATPSETLPSLYVASSAVIVERQNGLVKKKLSISDATSTDKLFSEILDIVPKIDTVLFKVSSVKVLPYGDIVLSNDTEKNSVKLSSDGDMNKEWSTVISAIDTEPLKGLLETKKDKLEYVDVRFGNKVFYKFTNTVIPTIINASTTENYVPSSTTTIQ